LKVNWRIVTVVVVIGFFVGFGSGLVENNPDSAGTAKYYGFPFAWRAVDEGGQKYAYPSELLADCVFGIVSVSIVAGTAMLTMKWMGKKKAQPSGNVARRKKAGGTKRKANVGRFVFEILYTLESSRNGNGWHFG
jgi:hypothetical protein